MVHDGLYLTDVVPRDTKEYKFIDAQFKYFSSYNMYLVTMEGFDYPRSQNLLFQLHDAFNAIKYVVKDSSNKLPNMWLHFFQEWLKGTNPVHFVHPSIYPSVWIDLGGRSLSHLPSGERQGTPGMSRQLIAVVSRHINICPLDSFDKDVKPWQVFSGVLCSSGVAGFCVWACLRARTAGSECVKGSPAFVV